MKVLTVVGARPQFIKAAVVSPALARAGVVEHILDTGQHYDTSMAAVFFDELEIPAPTWSLGVGSGSHGRQTADMLVQIEEVVLADRPDLVIVYGDTNSTLAGALAAAKVHVPVAHVEAGLRSFNRRMPEELNRIIADQLSSLLLAPSRTAVDNLAREGIRGESVVDVGDVMYDLAMMSAERADESALLGALDLVGVDFALVTVHRAENTDDAGRFAVIVEAVSRLAADMPVVWPAHPRTRTLLTTFDLPPSLQLVEPVGYLDMVTLERGCSLVVTDSGGVQKEAYFHGRPCVVVRDETEWVELVELGWVHLAPPTSAASVGEVIERAVGTTGNASARPFGIGAAADSIAEALGKAF